MSVAAKVCLTDNRIFCVIGFDESHDQEMYFGRSLKNADSPEDQVKIVYDAISEGVVLIGYFSVGAKKTENHWVKFTLSHVVSVQRIPWS